MDDTYYDSEKFVREYLKEAIFTLCQLGDKGLDEDETETLISLLNVLRYVSISQDYENFVQENKEAIAIALKEDSQIDTGTSELAIINVSENADGSANIDAIVGDTIRHHLIGEGLNFVLIKNMLEEASTDQVLIWARHGKQQEKTNFLVDKFSSIYNEDTK